jgi:metallo-beta-lactamase class B
MRTSLNEFGRVLPQRALRVPGWSVVSRIFASLEYTAPMHERGHRMSRRRWLSLAALNLSACVAEFGIPSSMWHWDRKFPAYRVIGNIHYVGSSDLAQFLIATAQGHILLDTGFEVSVPRLRDQVQKLGYRFEDIVFVINSHAHIDHVQGHAVVRQLTHAKVVASALDAPFIESGGKGETVFDGIYSWRPCPVDRRIVDGDRVTLGGTTLTARITPGHTKGATTWTMQVASGSRMLDVVFFPSANVNRGVRLIGNRRYPTIASDFEHSFAVWKSLPCDVFLGAHADFYDMRAKYDRLSAKGGVNPFIDRSGYRRAIAEAEQRFRDELESER